MHSAADSAVDDVVKRLEVGRLLPWRMVTFSTWVDLANKLDIVSPVLNNDWHKLAELLKFSTEAILVILSLFFLSFCLVMLFLVHGITFFIVVCLIERVAKI